MTARLPSLADICAHDTCSGEFIAVELTDHQLDIKRRAYAAGKEFAEPSIKWDAEDRVDYAAVARRMGELGFFGLTAPKEYGGQGLTCLDYFLAVSEILRASSSPPHF